MTKKRHWTLAPPVAYGVYLLMRVLLAVVHMFQYRQAVSLGRVLGRVLRVVGRRHVRIARKNLERSPGVVPEGGMEAMLDRVFAYLGVVLVEVLMIPKLLERRQAASTFRLDRPEIWTRCLERGRGVITVIGHLGNYELGGIVVNQSGYRLHSLARPVLNPYVDRYLTRFRTMTGQKIISTENPIGEMIRTLRGNGNLVIEIDQDAKRDGVLVDFLGRKASAHRSAALFAIKYGSPIVMVTCYRDRTGNVCALSDPIDPAEYRDRPDGVEALTQRVTSDFEAMVRKRPEQWFWVYDRWRGAEKLEAAVKEIAPLFP